MARAKRTARAEARRRYRAEHPLATETELDDAEGGPEDDEAPPPGRRTTPARPAGPRDGGRPVRPGLLGSFRAAYAPADFRTDFRALPELLRSRAVTIPALLVVISAVILVIAVQTSPSLVPGIAGASGSPSPTATIAASPTASPASSASPAAADASAAASGAVTDGGATVSGSPLGVVASILALLFLGIPSPPAIGGIYLAAILAKRSSYLAGGIAGLVGSLGALAAVLAISPEKVGESIGVFWQILATSVVFGVVIGAGLGYYRRLLRLMNPTPNRPAGRSKQVARRR